MHIKNPYNVEYDSAVIISNIQVELQLQISEQFNLTGKVKNVTFNVQNVETYFETETTLEEVQEHIAVFIQPI